HRRPYRASIASSPVGSGDEPFDALSERLETNRPGADCVPRSARFFSQRRLGTSLDWRAFPGLWPPPARRLDLFVAAVHRATAVAFVGNGGRSCGGDATPGDAAFALHLPLAPRLPSLAH